MIAKLTDAEVTARLTAIDGWALERGELTRTFVVRDFMASLLLVNAAGLLAEAAGHHPDVTIKWNRVSFALTTHDAGGLTEKDFALATQINALPTLK
jgi:4a-hydroxytetrahydrobiopterin dehydratase